MKETITLAQLKRLIAADSQVDLAQVDVYVDQMIRIVIEALLDEEYVQVEGFGIFEIVRNGETERNVVRYTPDARIKASVNAPFNLFESVVLDVEPQQQVEPEAVQPAPEPTMPQASRPSPRPLNIDLPVIEVTRKVNRQEPALQSENEIIINKNMEESQKNQPEVNAAGGQAPQTEPVNPNVQAENKPEEIVFEEVKTQSAEIEPEAAAPAAPAEESQPESAASAESPAEESETSSPEPAAAAAPVVKPAAKKTIVKKPAQPAELKKNPALIFVVVLLGILILVTIIYFVVRTDDAEKIAAKPATQQVAEPAATDAAATAKSAESAGAAATAEQKAETAKPAQPAKKSNIARHKVKSGEHLAVLSRKYYNGKTEFWVYIFDANKKALKNPNAVVPGMQLDIPALSNYGINKVTQADIDKAKSMEKELKRKYK